MPSSADDVLDKGSTLQNGRYVIEATLGQGGFGITYRAFDTKIGRSVAIKEYFINGCRRSGSMVFYSSAYTEETWGQRVNNFINEARIIARLNKHPNIVSVYDYFEENDTAYMVMEFIEGISLMAMVASRGKLPEVEALRYISEVGAALTVLHTNNVLHRDIKPSNIMVGRDDQAVLIDFGAAREYVAEVTMSQTTTVSLDFSPPEQFRPRARRGPYTDIYALAGTCYYLLTGKPPEIDENGRLEDEGVIQPQIFAALKHAMAMLPTERPQSIPEFLAELTTMMPPKKDEPEIATPLVETAPPPPTSGPIVDPAPAQNSIVVSQADSSFVTQPPSTLPPAYINANAVSPLQPDARAQQQNSQPVYGWTQPGTPDTTMPQGNNWQPQPMYGWPQPGTLDARVREESNRHRPAHRGATLAIVAAVAAVALLGVLAVVLLGSQGNRTNTSTQGAQSLPTQTNVVNTPTLENLLPHNILSSIYMVSATDGWVVGTGGVILHYSGGNWSKVNSPTTEALNGAYMISASDGWAVGWNGTILHYSGGNWSTVNSPTGTVLVSVYMVSADEGWAVGQDGTILRYSGGSWTTVNSPTGAYLDSVYMVSASEGWAVGINGTILHYSGGNWTTVSSPTGINLESVYMVSANEGWIVGQNGTILTYSGGSWTTVNSPISVYLASVYMVSATEGWAVGATGTILHYSGGRWTTVNSPTDQYLFSVYMVSASEGWAAGNGGTIVHYQNGVWSKYQ